MQAAGLAGHAVVRKRSDLRAQERQQLWAVALAAASRSGDATAAADSMAGPAASAPPDSLSNLPPPPSQPSGLAAAVELGQAKAVGSLPLQVSTAIRFLVVKGWKDGQKAVVQTANLPFAMEPGWRVPGLLDADGKGWLWMAAWDKWMAPDVTIGSKLDTKAA